MGLTVKTESGSTYTFKGGHVSGGRVPGRKKYIGGLPTPIPGAPMMFAIEDGTYFYTTPVISARYYKESQLLV